MKKNNLIVSILVFIVLIFFISCGDKGKVRKHTEDNVKTKTKTVKKSMAQPSGNIQNKNVSYEWDTPEGWGVGKSTSRIRLATLIVDNSKEDTLCTIIPLLGDGGGFEPNVKLWLEQIGINMDPASNDFKEFINKSEKFKTKSGLDVVKIDTSDLVKNSSDNSVMVSIIKLENSTVFIKFKGKKSILEKNKEKFKSLSLSFRIKK